MERKKNIVFLPYKASMWDSMESVWLAAKDDSEHCNAYVVPIPYADRNPDGSVREWHCEADEYPDYVPVEDWQTFDLKGMHPDAIVIHSPYDDMNLVTSVDARFYSRNLKFYTDRLVYIPYFVSDSVSVQNPAFAAQLKHFVTTPGVLNADMIFVQSEAVRRIYIDILSRQNDAIYRRRWSERVVGCGSPKTDRAIVAKNNLMALDLPKEWHDILFSPTGKNKKVFFFNTGIAALLANGEAFLRNMQRVFALFAENGSDVTLLWRPHPLLLSTIMSMRPGLIDVYEKMVAWYKATKIGIYDDTADLNRAIGVADMFMGDPSSVVALFEAVGKPAFFLDGSMGYDGVNYPIRISSYALYENDLYFMATSLNGFLCRMNLDELQPRIYDVIEDSTSTNYLVDARFADIVRVGQKLYFSPTYDNYVVEYDLLTKSEKRINFDFLCPPSEEHSVQYNRNFKFDKCFSCAGYIWFLPRTFPGILRLNVDTKSVDVLDKWVAEYEKIMSVKAASGANAYFMRAAVRRDDKIFIPCFLADAILVLDAHDGSHKFVDIVVGGEMKGFTAGAVVEDDFFLLTKDCKQIVHWSPKRGLVKRVGVSLAAADGEYRFMSTGIYDGRFVYFMAGNGNVSVKIDTLNYSVEDFSLETKTVRYWSTEFGLPIKCGDRIFLQHTRSSEIVEIGRGNGEEIRRKRLMLDSGNNAEADEHVKSSLVKNRASLSGMVFNENPIYSLSRVCRLFAKTKFTDESIGEQEMSSGTKIYGNIMNGI